MARDMDFSPKKRQAQAPKVNLTPSPVVVNSIPPAVTKPVSSRRSNWLIWLVIILIIAGGVFAFWHYFQPTTTSQNTPPTTLSTTTPALGSTTTTGSLVASKNSLPTVQIYDSGAGPEAVTKVMANLKALGYTTDNEDKSQFNYDKTYVWYITGLEADAAKIGSALAPRQVELKESKSAGSFEIMVLLGTK